MNSVTVEPVKIHENKDKNVAEKGVIKGVGSGTCKVYVTTVNGISKALTVTVK